jgi:hypothetical protein
MYAFPENPAGLSREIIHSRVPVGRGPSDEMCEADWCDALSCGVSSLRAGQALLSERWYVQALFVGRGIESFHRPSMVVVLSRRQMPG